ncbi:hypothetical protein Ocin01_15841 [Orchesella cincta]|uniref:Uncharacterized protein n=1 Tax=Orchesella cincta TaxID=48709 RepID=A0A1D2MCY8_ORCCI|nr:hypothetical protein Ocin01_15841 [Orchesella cincta]
MAKILEVGDREVPINRSLLSATPSSVSTDVIPPTPETENNTATEKNPESQKDKSKQISDEETPTSTSSAASASGLKRGVTCDSHPSRKKAKVCSAAAPLVGPREGETPNMIQDNSVVVKTEPPEDEIADDEAEFENLANVVITTTASGEENAPTDENELVNLANVVLTTAASGEENAPTDEANVVITTATSEEENAPTDETNGNGLEIPPTNGSDKNSGSQSASRNPNIFIYNTRSKSKSTKLSDNSENPCGSSTGNAPTIESPVASTSFQRNVEDPQTSSAGATNGSFDVDCYLKRIQKNYLDQDSTNVWSWDLTFKSMKMMEMMDRENHLTTNPDLLNTCMENTYYLRRNEVVLREMTITEAVMYFPGLKLYEQIQKEFGRCKGVLLVKKFENALLSKLSKQGGWKYRCTHKHAWCVWAKKIMNSDKIEKDEKLASLVLYICCKTDSTGALNILNFNGKGDVIDGMESLSPGQKNNLKVERLQPCIQLAGGLKSIFDNCSVVCEKQTVLSNVSFVEAFFAVYYLFYCFNMEYTGFDKKLFENFDTISARF